MPFLILGPGLPVVLLRLDPPVVIWTPSGHCRHAARPPRRREAHRYCPAMAIVASGAHPGGVRHQSDATDLGRRAADGVPESGGVALPAGSLARLAADGEYEGSRFTIARAGRRYATPLLLVLVAIEAADIVFAVDSIHTVFAVTHDPFIVYTSNIFAVLGLRAL